MKELSKEVQMIYDFCEKCKKDADANSEAASDIEISMMFSQKATCYWDIQQFIEANFLVVVTKRG